MVYIEDDLDIIQLVQLILRPHGFKVFGAAGGKEGLDMVRRVKPDLVLLDLMMPEIDGWDVYKAMKSDSELSRIPVIVITVKSGRSDRMMGLHVYRVDDYISKPFTMQRLLHGIHRVLSVQSR